MGPPGIPGNDTDPDGRRANGESTAVLGIRRQWSSIEPVKGPGKRKLTLKTDGSFTYGPRPNFHGTVSLTHTATDGAADSNVAIVTIR